MDSECPFRWMSAQLGLNNFTSQETSDLEFTRRMRPVNRQAMWQSYVREPWNSCARCREFVTESIRPWCSSGAFLSIARDLSHSGMDSVYFP